MVAEGESNRGEKTIRRAFGGDWSGEIETRNIRVEKNFICDPFGGTGVDPIGGDTGGARKGSQERRHFRRGETDDGMAGERRFPEEGARIGEEEDRFSVLGGGESGGETGISGAENSDIVVHGRGWWSVGRMVWGVSRW